MEQSDYEVLSRFFSRGGSLRMLKDVDQDELDCVYAYACQLFQADDLDMAKRILMLLVRIDQWNFDYWLALGLTCQRLTQHDEAIFCFTRSGTIRMKDPRSSYFAGISYQIVGNREYAGKAFHAAVKWCAQHPEYQAIRSRALTALTGGETEGQA